MDHIHDKASQNKIQSISASLNEKTVQNKVRVLQDNRSAPLLQKKANNTGLPNDLKTGIENLSGHTMDDVKVHYNSDKPAQLNAHAYAQGTDIHIASGQEKHLAHEAWHVVQQKQGRVKPTLQMKGKVNINDDKGLEKEADVMGKKALQRKENSILPPAFKNKISIGNVAQLNGEEHGLVPPKTHGRSKEYTSPITPASTTKGHHHAVSRKGLTRFERMIDRIGRILATDTNVHVAVALDDKTLVVSVNKESPEQEKKLETVAAKLKNVITSQDPLGTSIEKRVSGARRTKDIAKTKKLLEEKYTHEDTGVETNEEVSSQLKRLIVAINKGVIPHDKYHKGEAGIYVVPTSTSKADNSYNMHGELKVSKAIKDRREKNNYTEKDVYIGGTLADCFACNASHKIMNEEIKKQLTHNDWSFYSGGTHGGLFKGYRVSPVATKNKDQFETLTGEHVEDGNIPKVNSIGKEPKSSFNEDSESEADDVDALSAYAIQRNKLIGIQKNLKASKKKLDEIESQIKAATKEHDLLLPELVKLTLEVKEPAYLKKIKDEKERFIEAQVKSAEIQQLVETKKAEVQKAIDELKAVEEKIKADPVVKGKTGKKPKPGLAVEFRSGKLGKVGWRTGEAGKISEDALTKLDEKHGYSTSYNNINTKKEELKASEVQLLAMEKSAGELHVILQHTEAPLHRKENLPAVIEKVKKDIEKLTAEKESMTEHIRIKKEERKSTRAARKLAANHGNVKDVQEKLDWLNKATVSEDQTEDQTEELTD